MPLDSCYHPSVFLSFEINMSFFYNLQLFFSKVSALMHCMHLGCLDEISLYNEYFLYQPLDSK